MLTLVQSADPTPRNFPQPSTNKPHRHTKDEMQRELLEQMYRSNELDDLLKESEYTTRRRKECLQMVESLGKAQEIVGQVQ